MCPLITIPPWPFTIAVNPPSWMSAASLGSFVYALNPGLQTFEKRGSLRKTMSDDGLFSKGLSAPQPPVLTAIVEWYVHIPFEIHLLVPFMMYCFPACDFFAVVWMLATSLPASDSMMAIHDRVLPRSNSGRYFSCNCSLPKLRMGGTPKLSPAVRLVWGPARPDLFICRGCHISALRISGVRLIAMRGHLVYENNCMKQSHSSAFATPSMSCIPNLFNHCTGSGAGKTGNSILFSANFLNTLSGTSLPCPTPSRWPAKSPRRKLRR